MLTLLKNLDCFAPQYIGKNDILLCNSKIEKIQPEIKVEDAEWLQVYDCEGCFAFPGLIDQHVHILGGGGELGFTSRVAEIKADDIIHAGVTTLVGLLGADGYTRSLESLYAKAKALEAGGITTFVYAGSYAMPPLTITGSIVKDLMFVDKVIGLGEIALSDHRSSHIGLEQMLKMASDTHLGGMLGGKAGVVHLHIGDGKLGLAPVLNMIEHSDLPMEQFVPTHVNRNPELFKQAVEYCKSGGNIDLTSGETEGISVPDAVERLVDNEIRLSNVTISSDANGSIPDGGVGSIQTIWDDVIHCVVDKRIKTEIVFGLVTQNVAKILKLYPNKGTLQEGSDGDILVTDRKYQMKKVFSSGKLLKEF
jgi:beta-aspartyl-dipeptidase (metallo-type)